MLSKRLVKIIKSLQIKKFRQREQLFFVEGEKVLVELLGSDYQITDLFMTQEFENSHPGLITGDFERHLVSEKELVELGTFKSNNAGLAIVKMPESISQDLKFQNHFTIALDDVRDPGNLGTILRLADWYGVKDVICSSSCVDVYNPKVLSATMGSFLRVNVHYVELEDVLKVCNVPIYAALLDGESVHTFDFRKDGCVLLMGNESNGISPKLLTDVIPITIPRFGKAESLNVALATGILCDRIRGAINLQ